jgi:hypothetical protein
MTAIEIMQEYRPQMRKFRYHAAKLDNYLQQWRIKTRHPGSYRAIARRRGAKQIAATPSTVKASVDGSGAAAVSTAATL